MSERALINQQQQQEAAEAASSRKRARVAKKKGAGAGIEVEVEELSSNSTRGAATDLSTGADDVVDVSPTGCTGLRDSAMVAAMKEHIKMDSMVPENLLHCLVQYLGENSVLLLASVNFEEPEVIEKINSIHAASSSSSPSSSSSFSATHSVISEDSIESWVACAQASVMCTISQVLCGGSRRLLAALRSLGQRCPSKLRVWRLVPQVLYKRLLEQDPGLEALCLSRGRSTEGAIALGVPFSEDWVRWMCGVCEDMRSDPLVLWIDHFSYQEEDEEAEEYDEEEVNEEEDEEDWVFTAAEGNFVGARVRCYPLNDDYWDDGVVIGYLPPTDAEPAALWRVRGERGGTEPNTTPGTIRAGDGSEERGKKMWTVDLDESELSSALALHIALRS